MMKRIVAIFISTILLLALCAPGTFLVATAGQVNGLNFALMVDDSSPVNVKAYRLSYENNILISLRDMAAALAGTPKAFSLTIEPDETETFRIVIRRDTPYVPVGGENLPFTALEVTDSFYADPTYHKLLLDSEELRLATYVYKSGTENEADVYLRLVDLGMYLDIPVSFTGEFSVSVNTESHYIYDLEQQDRDGYFHYLHSILLADADTGCILYEHNGDTPTAIASTTKLFTYLLVKEALDRGDFQEDSFYTVSEAVYREANSEDGIYSRNSRYGSLDLGAQVSVADLLAAMLLRSSNEAATALAEMVSDSEEEFVTLMNQRAAELGLDTAQFYNPHGLPSFSQSVATAKRQNEMSAADMFALTQYLLENHGDHLTAITQQKRVELTTFGPAPKGKVAYAPNTNAHLYNLPGCLGLKTGTTNRAGSSLVCALPVTDVAGQTHNLVVIIFGAEDDIERYEKSGWLLKYAQQYYRDHPFPVQEQIQEETEPGVIETEPVVIETVPEETQLPEIQNIPKQPTSSKPEKEPPVLLLVVSGCTGAVITLALVFLIGRLRKTEKQDKTDI